MRTNSIFRACVWLSRIGYCRGFGIQSPWAYSFVRYVVNEHYPYYKYKEVAEYFNGINVLQRKMGEFYLRLANFAQPSNIVSFYCSDDKVKYSEAYFSAGCKRCRFNSYANDEFWDVFANRDADDGPYIVQINGLYVEKEMLSELVDILHDGDFIVIERADSGKKTVRLCEDVYDNLLGILLFDLYYCDVIYVDSKRYMHKYIINF